MLDDVAGVDLSREIIKDVLLLGVVASQLGVVEQEILPPCISDAFGFSAALARLCCIVVGYSCQPFVLIVVADLCFSFSMSPMVRSLPKYKSL